MEGETASDAEMLPSPPFIISLVWRVDVLLSPMMTHTDDVLSAMMTHTDAILLQKRYACDATQIKVDISTKAIKLEGKLEECCGRCFGGGNIQR